MNVKADLVRELRRSGNPFDCIPACPITALRQPEIYGLRSVISTRSNEWAYRLLSVGEPSGMKRQSAVMHGFYMGARAT